MKNLITFVTISYAKYKGNLKPRISEYRIMFTTDDTDGTEDGGLSEAESIAVQDSAIHAFKQFYAYVAQHPEARKLHHLCKCIYHRVVYWEQKRRVHDQGTTLGLSPMQVLMEVLEEGSELETLSRRCNFGPPQCDAWFAYNEAKLYIKTREELEER